MIALRRKLWRNIYFVCLFVVVVFLRMITFQLYLLFWMITFNVYLSWI